MSEDKEDFQVDGVYTQDKDMNNNGIPDVQEHRDEPAEPESPHVDRVDWEPTVANAYPYTQSKRDAQGHLVGTYDVSDEHGRSESVRNAATDAHQDKSAFEKSIESDPNKASDNKSFREALHSLEIRRLQTPKRQKSSLQAELSRARPPKEEPKTGLELGQELLKGLVAGFKAQAQRKKEADFDRDLKKAEKLILDNAAEKDLKAAMHANDERGGSTPPSATPGPDGGPSGPQSGPSGSDSNGPGGNQALEPAQERQGAGELGTIASAEVTGADGRDPRVDATAEQKDISRPEAASIVKAADTSAEKDAVVTANPAAGRTEASGEKPAKESDAAEVNGQAGLGAAVATINPVAGPALTAIQTQTVQKEAGQSHQQPGQPLMPVKPKGPNASERPVLSLASSVNPKGRKLDLPSKSGGMKPAEAAKPVRRGKLYAQAASLPRPASAVHAKGPLEPVSRTRTIGLGMSISGYVLNTVRGPEGKGVQQGPDLFDAYKKQRDQSGRGL